MKPMKVAAVVAGSVMALGAASPAFAEGMSLNGGLETIASEGLRDIQPLHTNALDTENEGSVLNAVKGVTDGLNKKTSAKQTTGKASGKTAGKGAAKGKGKGKGTQPKGSQAKGSTSKVGQNNKDANKGNAKGNLLGGLPLGG
ncbi:hypothetical protein [Streptomyces sp. NRRL F-5135]|uniref:hypothetical protein n=1 Tax=Streptomyces sp. NRRL F-5135 TaxID=1463858 RepID=UPI0007C56C71|nr:hypothetical protein [Streptomyces sp. NRRL F-5135]